MKNPKLWISLGVAGLIFIGVMVFAVPAFATNKPPAKPPTPIVITEHHTDYRGALVTGLVVYFVMRHRAKKHRPLVIEPTCPVDERVERILETCLSK